MHWRTDCPFQRTTKHQTVRYIKNKPCKWGIKVFLLCGLSGLVYDGIVYQGKQTGLCEDSVMKYGSTGALVINLSLGIPSNRNHKLFAVNSANSLLVSDWYLLCRNSTAESYVTCQYMVVVWHSGNVVGQINEVTLRQARLVLGWVTVYGCVNHLGM